MITQDQIDQLQDQVNVNSMEFKLIIERYRETIRDQNDIINRLQRQVDRLLKET